MTSTDPTTPTEPGNPVGVTTTDETALPPVPPPPTQPEPQPAPDADRTSTTTPGPRALQRMSAVWAAHRPAVVVTGAAIVVVLTLAGVNAYNLQNADDWQARALAGEEQASSLQERLERSEARVDALTSRVGTLEDAADDVAAESARLDTRSAELDTREQGLTAREAAVSATEDRIAATRITEGTWTVGVDLQPGTYRTTEAVSGSCYWGIYRSGTNGDDILQNDIVTGGFPTVTLSESQDFTTTRCGSWDLQ